MTEFEKIAKRYSKYKNSCSRCVWDANPYCLCPYSDGLMEDYHFSGCYFGVYRFMSGGALCQEEASLIELLKKPEKT